MKIWNNRVKKLLKAEIAKKGISNAELAVMLQNIGVKETKSSIDSKISRGTFSAAFLIQCFAVMGSTHISLDSLETAYKDETKVISMAAEPQEVYKTKGDSEKE